MFLNESIVGKLKELMENEEVTLENLSEHINADNQQKVSDLIQENIESLSYKEIVRNNIHGVNSEVLDKILKSVLKVILKPEILSKKVRLQTKSEEKAYETPFILKMSPDENELNQSVNQDQSQSFLNYDDKVTLFGHHMDS